MFLNYYGLHSQPFGVTSDPRFLYLGASHREALASLCYGIRSGRGFLGLIAQPGMGKTTVLTHLLETLRESARTAFLFQSQCDSRDFLRLLLTDLGITSEGWDFVRMQRELNEVLIRELNAGRPFVIVIDEAQALENSVLETIRMLSNFETPRAKLMQIVLSGQPQLADRLASPELVQLRQRISILCRLTPLTAAETAQYISHRLRLAGYAGAPLFSPEALAIISSQSGGIPRNINNLCFHALTIGFAKSEKIIDSTILEEVLADLNLNSACSPLAVRENSRSGDLLLPVHVSSSGGFKSNGPGQTPSAASEPANMPPSFAPRLQGAGPSRMSANAPRSAKDASSARAAAIRALRRNVTTFGRGISLMARFRLRRTLAAASTISSALAGVARSIPLPAPGRRSTLAVASTAVLLLVGEAGSMFSSRHESTVAAGDDKVRTTVNAVSEPTSPLHPDAAELVPAPEPALERSGTSAQAFETALPSRLDSPHRDRIVKRAGGERKRSAEIAADSGVPPVKPRDVLAEELPLPSAMRSRMPEIRMLAPASPPGKGPSPQPAMRIGGDVVPPKLLSSVPPVYPSEAKRVRVSGDVTIQARVNTSGQVEDMTVLPGSPMMLQESARRALRAWKYEPARLNGQPVQANVVVTVRFRDTAAPPSEQAARDTTKTRPLKESLSAFACRVLKRSDCSSAAQPAEDSASGPGEAKP